MNFFRIKPSKKSFIVIAITCIFIYILFIPVLITMYTKKYIYSDYTDIPAAYTALVLGAQVTATGAPSSILQDRLAGALLLYNNHIVERFLLSGDHGTRAYDEVNSMKNILLSNGVDSNDIFLDHAGFNTYNSILRAKKIFEVTDLIVVTQRYHLPRAVYIARKNRMNAYGYVADKRRYSYMNFYKKREYFAKIKSFFDVLLNKKPKFLGEKIHITEESRRSWD